MSEENVIVKLVIPALEQLAFRQQLLGDKKTMTFNQRWGGVIDFPESRWKKWYEKWLRDVEEKYFYRYIFSEKHQCFVGETSYHYNEEFAVYTCDVLICAEFRGQGLGKSAMKLLCENARKNGIQELYDNIAVDNPSVELFLNMGFYKAYETDEFVMMKKELKTI